MVQCRRDTTGSSRYTSPRGSRPMRRSSSPSGKTEPFNGPEIATILGFIKGEIVHNERKYIECASDSMQDRKCRSSNAPADASLEAAEQQCSGRCKPGNGRAAMLRQMQAWKRRSSIVPADASLETAEQHCSGRCKPGSGGATLLPQM